jgi:hypothetical protein
MIISFSRFQSALLAWVLLLTAPLLSIGVVAPASAAVTGVCWAWNMDNKATGNFLTDGTHDGVTAAAGTYTLSDFKVNSSIYPTVEAGSISNGTYAFGSQPPYSFVWNGAAPTIFQRASYSDLGWNRNGFGINHDSTDGSGAYIGFGIESSYIGDEVYGTTRYSSSNTISLSPTARTDCDLAPVAPVVEYQPEAIQFLTTLTPPKLIFSDGNLLCMAGEYRSGYIIDGVIQGDATAKYKPGIYVFTLIIDGVPQTSLAKTVKGFNGAGWDQETTAPSGTMATCSVTVTVNHLTNIDKSSDSNEGTAAVVSAAKATLATATAAAESAYELAKIQNAKDLASQLGWVSFIRSQGTWATRLSYFYQNQDLDRDYWRGSISRDNYFAARSVLRQKEADEVRNFPVMLDSITDYYIGLKDTANKAAPDARNAAIAKANTAYGAEIQSTGYGVLIP